jgi:glycosyltransferase involved in cell wall biosynthesis
MKLSVLMSVYKNERAAHLKQSLESLALQARPAHEVVLVEDGPLGARLSDTIAEYRRVLPIVTLALPVQGGLGQALCAGLSQCTGELVARMDSDDVCVPRRFARQMEFLECNQEIDVVGGAIAEFNEDIRRPHSIRRLPGSSDLLAAFAKSRNPLNHMTVMFRRAAVLAAGSYRSCMGFEDYDLWARMLMRGCRMHNLNDVLVYVRCGNGMQVRRGGLAYANQEMRLQRLLYDMRFLSAGRCALNMLLRLPVRLVPAPLRLLYYQQFLREQLSPARIAKCGDELLPRLGARGEERGSQ